MSTFQRVSLVQAAHDPRLLGGTFNWRPAQLELLELADGPAQLALIAAARQTGKSTVGGAAAVHNSGLRPDLDDMLPHGKWRTVPVIAPSESQAKDFASVCAAMVENSPVLREYADIRVGEILFRLPRVDEHGHKWVAKTAIRAMPASAPSIRGLTAAMVICEEMAHHGDTGGPADERRIWDAITPMQTVFGARAKVLGISTPFGETGLFAELFAKIEAGLMPHAVAVRRSITEMIPDIDPAWLEARRLELGQVAYEQEFEARFVGSGGAFFSLEGIELEEGPARPEEGRNWTAALDPAFHGDTFGVALVGESVTERGVVVVGACEGIQPSGKARSLERRRAREDRALDAVWEIMEPYRPRRVVSDVHQADAIRSYFGRRGLSVLIENLSAPKQTAAFTSTRARMVDGSLRLWKHPQLVEELRRVRAKDTETIHLPRFGGSHCDIAAALCLGVFQFRLLNDAPRSEVRTGGTPISSDDRTAEETFVRRGHDPDWDGMSRTPPAGWPGGAEQGIRGMRF